MINETDKSIRKNILSMIIPITSENILQMAAGTVTMAFMGRLDAASVGAVGIGNIIFRMTWAMFKGMGIGASAAISRYYGSNDNTKIFKLIVEGLLAIILFSIVVQQIVYRFSVVLIGFLSNNNGLMGDSLIFTNIISISIPFMAIIVFTAGVFQGMTNSKTPMIIVGFMNILNIIFSYFFIFGKLGLPKLGIKGAAFAFNISHLGASIISIIMLVRVCLRLKPNIIEKFKLNNTSLLELFKYGIPSAMEMLLWQLSSIVLTKAVLSYGETAFASFQLGMQAESISYMPAAGFSIAATAFIGQHLGANDFKHSITYMKELKKMVVIVTVCMGAILVFLPNVIMRVLTNNYELIEIGSVYLIVMGVSQLPQNLSGLYNGAIRGAGYPNIPLLTTIVGIWLIRIPMVIFVVYYLKCELVWVWIAMALDLFSRYFFSKIAYVKKVEMKYGG